jgi:hypothetical protein
VDRGARVLSRAPSRDGRPPRLGAPLREAPSKERAPEGRALDGRSFASRSLDGRLDGRPLEALSLEGRALEDRDGPPSSRSPRYGGRSLCGAPLAPVARPERAAGRPERLGPSDEDLVSVRLVRAGRADEELRLDDDVRLVEDVRLDEPGRAGRPLALRAGRAPPFLGSSSSERQAPAGRLGGAPLVRPLGAPGRPELPLAPLLPPLDPPPELDPPRAEGARRDGRGESAGIQRV